MERFLSTNDNRDALFNTTEAKSPARMFPSLSLPAEVDTTDGAVVNIPVCETIAFDRTTLVPGWTTQSHSHAVTKSISEYFCEDEKFVKRFLKIAQSVKVYAKVTK